MQTNLTISRIYAKAIFDLSLKNKSFKIWKTLLIQLIKISKFQGIKKFFNVVYSNDRILKIITIMCNDFQLDNLNKNFIKLLIINRRLDLLDVIFDQFIILYNQSRKIVNFEITTVNTLSQNQKKNIILCLKKKFKTNVNLICKTDSSILYGIILKYDDIIIDNCISSRFFELSNFLIA